MSERAVAKFDKGFMGLNSISEKEKLFEWTFSLACCMKFISIPKIRLFQSIRLELVTILGTYKESLETVPKSRLRTSEFIVVLRFSEELKCRKVNGNVKNYRKIRRTLKI